MQVASKAVKYYLSVGRVPDANNLHYDNVLQHYKLAVETYKQLKSWDSSYMPDVKDSDKEKKVTKWTPVFIDCMSCIFRIKGPLAYILYADTAVIPEVNDLLTANAYYSSSGGLQ